jgi:hypothetical protein
MDVNSEKFLHIINDPLLSSEIFISFFFFIMKKNVVEKILEKQYKYDRRN